MRCAAGCLLAVALLAGEALAQQPLELPTAALEAPASSFALTTGPVSLSGNPGALAFTSGLELDYLHRGSYSGGHGHGDGLFLGAQLGALALGGGVDFLHPDGGCASDAPCARRFSYGAGLRLGQVGIGAQLHTFSSADRRDLDDLVTVAFGFLARPLRWLSAGGAVLDANQPSLTAATLGRRYVAAVGLRPFDERTELALDALVRECADGVAVPCGLGHADLFATLETQLLPGARLVGQVGLLHESRPGSGRPLSGQIGLQLDLAHLGARYAATFARDRDAGYALQLRASTDRFASLRVRRSRAALLDLGQALERQRPGLVALVLGQEQQDPLAQTIEALHRLAGDASVKGLVLKSGELPLGPGRCEELRSGIEEVRRAGKKVLFYLESGGDLEYYVASSADGVYASPQAVLTVNGFSATALFAAAGLDKLGVKAEFFRVGAYKNAPDAFTRSDMSSEQREVQDALLDDLYGRYVRAIAGQRHLDEAKVKALLDKGLLQPREAKEAGLLDGLLYPDQLEEEMGKLLGGKVALEEASVEPKPLRDERWGQPRRIAVVRVEGVIVQGRGGRDPFGAVQLAGSEPISRSIRAAADDPGVAAIVVRIDSPGGDGSASDLIWRELVRARKEKHKPVVASMGDAAASGGYYVAAGADEIVAEPSTITGSIGVFIGHFDAEELYARLGLAFETTKRGQSADLFSTTRELTASERKTMQSWVDSFYDEFVGRVAEGRGLTKAQVDAVGRGRVWSGAQALQRGLVDRLGGLAEAIRAAKDRAGAGDDAAVEDSIPIEVGLPELALQGALGAAPLGAAKKALRAVQHLGAPGTIRAVMPAEIEVR